MKPCTVGLAIKTGSRVVLGLVHSKNTVQHTVFLKLQPAFSGYYLMQLLKCSAEEQSDSSYLEDDLV